MQIISWANDKGGIGKTSLTMLFGEYLARQGFRTLLIDLDPQANLSRRFINMEVVVASKDVWRPPKHPDYVEISKTEGRDWDGRSSSSDIWIKGRFYEYPTQYENLKIVPATSGSLGEIEYLPKERMFNDVITHFQRMMRQSGLEEDFDAVLIDTRPSKGPLTTAALFASDWIAIPTQMQSPAVEGLIGVLNLRNVVNMSRTQDNQLKVAAIVPNMVKHNSLQSAHLADMKANPMIGQHLTSHHLSDRVAFARAMEVNSPSIYTLSPSDKARIEIESLCASLVEKTMLQKGTEK